MMKTLQYSIEFLMNGWDLKPLKYEHTLSVLVEDESGALSRISVSSLEGFNIDNAVGPAESKGISRLTMVVEGDDETLQQMTTA